MNRVIERWTWPDFWELVRPWLKLGLKLNDELLFDDTGVRLIEKGQAHEN